MRIPITLSVQSEKTLATILDRSRLANRGQVLTGAVEAGLHVLDQQERAHQSLGGAIHVYQELAGELLAFAAKYGVLPESAEAETVGNQPAPKLEDSEIEERIGQRIRGSDNLPGLHEALNLLRTATEDSYSHPLLPRAVGAHRDLWIKGIQTELKRLKARLNDARSLLSDEPNDPPVAAEEARASNIKYRVMGYDLESLQEALTELQTAPYGRPWKSKLLNQAVANSRPHGRTLWIAALQAEIAKWEPKPTLTTAGSEPNDPPVAANPFTGDDRLEHILPTLSDEGDA